MPDPLSITTAVLGIIAQSVHGIQTIQGYFNKYQIADLTIASTRTECSTIRVALLQIQNLLTHGNSTITSEKEEKDTSDPTLSAFNEYQAVMGACSITFSVLNERMAELDVYGVDQSGKSSSKAKLKALWNDDEMNLLRQNIRGQAIAVNLMLSAFQAETSAKTYQLLRERRNQKILEDVSDGARTLLSKSHRVRTITLRDVRGDNGDGDDDDSVIGDEVFDFDDIVINSTAYRRAFYSFNIKARQSDGNVGGKEGSEQEPPSNTQPNASDSTDNLNAADGNIDKGLSINVNDILLVRDEDYFEIACQRLFAHMQDFVVRFSKFSDLRVCRASNEIHDFKILDRFENAILDSTDLDLYLSHRVRRRDVFTSVAMTMIWEYVFTRYLFGLDRKQRQELKAIEKSLSESNSGPYNTASLWRAMTCKAMLNLPAFIAQRDEDVEKVTWEIFHALAAFLPPPSHLEQQLISILRRVVSKAATLSHEMRTQWAEYIMLPPLQPEHDANGDPMGKIKFNASLMNHQEPGTNMSNEELERQGATISILLLPLVIKRGNDAGRGEDDVVVCPAQVLVSRKFASASARPSMSTMTASTTDL